MQLRNVIIKTEGTFMKFQDLIFQRIQRTDKFSCSEASSDWLWTVGEFRTPASSPAQGVGSVCQKRGTYGWWQCVNPVLHTSSWRSLWQKWGWNWKATLNCLNHSPSSLFLQLTSGVETCEFTTQIAAAGRNGTTRCCSSSDPPCPGASRAAGVGMAAQGALQFTGALFLGFAFFSLLPHTYFALTPLPGSLPQSPL